MIRALFGGCSALVFVAIPMVAAAQVVATDQPTLPDGQTTSSTTQADTSQADTTDDIVIRASKTGEALSRSPVSASVLTGADLAQAQIRSTEDVAARTPSIVYNTVQQRAQVFIRGVGSSFALAGAESAVASYVDGVYLQRQGGSNLGLFDIASVQVLRGPQSVLYGRNATGGAVVVDTNDPTRDFGGYLEGNYGNFDTYRLEGVVNVPINEQLSARISGLASGNSPLYRNTGAGRDVGEQQSRYIRGKLLWTPSERFEALLQVEHFTIYGSPQAQHQRSSAPCLGCTLAGVPTPTGFYEVSTNNRTGPLADGLKGHESKIRTTALTARLTYTADTFNIKSVTGYRDQDVLSRSDNDKTTAELFVARVDETGPTLTQDVYLTTTLNGRFNALVGGFYERERDTQSATFTGAFFAPLQPGQRYEALVDALAIYGDAWFNLTPELRLTGGVRWSQDIKRNHVVNTADGTIAAGGLASYDQRRRYAYATPHAVLSYTRGGQYYYASYSEGVRSGFFSSPSFTPLAPLESERLKTYEVGAKNNFLNGTIHTELSVFYGKFENIIVQYNDPASGGIRAQNAASAELYGAEFEASISVDDHLSVNAGAAYLHNRFQDYTNAAVFVPVGGVLQNSTEDLSGTVVPRAPTVTGFLGIDYITKFLNGWSARGSVNANYTAKYDFTAGAGGPLRLDRQDGFALVNLQVTVATPAERLYIKAFVRNLTKTKYLTDAATDTFGAAYIPGSPRIYGIGVGTKF